MKTYTWYDEACKKLLTNKTILYNILKRLIPEYKNLSFEELMPLISNLNESIYLESKNTEDSFISGEPIYYDVLLYGRFPMDHKEGMVINLEIQANMPAYSILKRGLYYLGRLIARQKGHEYGFIKSEYNHLKKVISIWICNTPKYLKGIINKYNFQEQMLTISHSFPKSEYDLMQLVIISPEATPSNENGILDFLSLLFGENLDISQTLKRLEQEYGVILGTQEKEEIEKMCNWSIAHYQNGYEEGIEQGLQQGELNGSLKEMHLTIQRMFLAGIHPDIIAIATGKNKEEVNVFIQQLSLS